MYAIGIHFDGSFIKAALLKKNSTKVDVEFLRTFSTDQESLDALNKIIKEKKATTVTGLKCSEIIRRELNFNLQKEAEIFKVLPFQMDSVIPYQEEERVAIPIFSKASDDSTDVVLFATQKKAVLEHLKLYQNYGIDPDVVSTIPAAFFRWGQLLFSDKNHLCIFHEESCVLFSQHKIEVSQVCGSEKEEMSRMEAFIKTKCEDPFFISNGNFPLSYDGYDFDSLYEYLTPIGLALDALKKDKKSMQIRQGELASEKRLKQNIKPALKYMCTSFAMALLVLVSTFVITSLEEKKLRQKMAHFSHGSKALSTHKTLDAILEDWNIQEQNQKQEPQLISKIPTVEETLSWIGAFKEEIEISHFHYALSNQNEKTKACAGTVEIQFTARNEAASKRFQEALKKQSVFINQNQEIKWTQNSRKNPVYTVSFYLNQVP